MCTILQTHTPIYQHYIHEAGTCCVTIVTSWEVSWQVQLAIMSELACGLEYLLATWGREIEKEMDVFWRWIRVKMMSNKIQRSLMMCSFAAFKWIKGTPSGNQSFHLGRANDCGSIFLHFGANESAKTMQIRNICHLLIIPDGSLSTSSVL